jgi:hypothetical protein
MAFCVASLAVQIPLTPTASDTNTLLSGIHVFFTNRKIFKKACYDIQEKNYNSYTLFPRQQRDTVCQKKGTATKRSITQRLYHLT